MDRYWNAVDAAFRFNSGRHDIYLAKTKVHGNVSKDSHKEDRKTKPNEIQQFFKRHQQPDVYHWHRRDAREDISSKQRNRFLLPKLRH